MQHWWKWLLAFAVMGILLLFGSVLWSSAGSAEAATVRRSGKVTDYWAGWSRPVSRVVPILTAGTPGVRLGLAQVTGPKRQVDRVKAVLQLNGDFRSVRAKILVPSDSYTDLRRVQGTAVSAVLQYQLLNFKSKKKASPAPAARPAPRYNTNKTSCPPKYDSHKSKGNKGGKGNHYGWDKQKSKCDKHGKHHD